jgi:hypothetical protein
VVRPDQGGDTVSEGQGYGMLLAEVAGDHAAFRRIWQWTRSHLRLGNGLFACHANAAGKVVSQQPASDGDLPFGAAPTDANAPRPNRPYCSIGAGAAVVAVVSRGSDGLALEPPADCLQSGLLTTCQPVGSLPRRGSKEARAPAVLK